MTTSKEKSVKIKNYNDTVAPLLKKFYDLKKTFKAEYSGKLRSYKYEETRSFTIALNYAIFQANQLHLNETNTKDSLKELCATFEVIKEEYQHLTK